MSRLNFFQCVCLALVLMGGLVGCNAGATLAPTLAAPTLVEPAPAATAAQDVVAHRLLDPTLAATVTATEILATDAPTATATAEPLPAEHYITAIIGHHQYFPLGCETAAAKDWANYFGADFNEFEFQFKLPQSDNPDYGFVGSVYSTWGQVPPYAYGVYAGPMADLLKAYGIQAEAHKGYTLDQLKAEIAADRPVIVWVIGNVVGGVPATYTDPEGRQVVVAAYEHVVIVTGYNAAHVRYMNNGKFYEAPTEVFLNSWGVLGDMVVVK